MNKKTILALAITAAAASTPAMAAPGGVVGGVVGTVRAVLAAPGTTVAGLVEALPTITNDAVAGVTNALNAVPPVLLGTPGLQNTSQSITVPLPGPAFLNATVAHLPGKLSVSATGAGPLVVTITTGNR
ncbi:MAG: hypothetical protein NTW01_04085 [Gammaproteobacteria bacterium]|nr:hypothetical protein [Gammaproteobacteria bacterium]